VALDVGPHVVDGHKRSSYTILHIVLHAVFRAYAVSEFSCDETDYPQIIPSTLANRSTEDHGSNSLQNHELKTESLIYPLILISAQYISIGRNAISRSLVAI
jgi:hypothetical protein